MKTTTFNCPSCSQRIETRAADAGSQISCPTCGNESVIPRGQTNRKLGIVLGVAALIFGSWILFYVLTPRVINSKGESIREESSRDRIKRWRDEAAKAMMVTCTNEIVGLRTIININSNFWGDAPEAWKAEITAEFVNVAGGVQRTNLPLVFVRHGLYEDSTISCYPDFAKLAKISMENLERELERARSSK